MLLAHAAGRDISWIIAHPEAEAPRFEGLLARRVAHEPLAYILERREFWSLDFQVSPATLIPRADSETLIEAALAACLVEAPLVLDLGTGTGCLLLAMLRERPGGIGFGVDISPDATALAARNARALGLADRAMFLCGNWDAALTPPLGGFDLVLSNPPYIPSRDIAGLMPEVGEYEPLSALDGGADGLRAYRDIIAGLDRLLARTGVAILELGIGQHDDVGRIAAAHGFSSGLRADLAGVPRAIALRRAEA